MQSCSDQHMIFYRLKKTSSFGTDPCKNHTIIFNMSFNENENNYIKIRISSNLDNHIATAIISSFFSVSPCYYPLHPLYLFFVTHSSLSSSPRSISRLALHLHLYLFSFRQDVVLYNQATIEEAAFFSAGSWFIQKQVVPGEDMSGTGSFGGKDDKKEREREILLCCGVSTKVRAVCARLARVCLHGKTLPWHV